MSVEQIMAINPNISPEAAKALAEKFKGEHLQSQVEMANQQKDEMRSFMEQQMALMREMVAGNKESSQAHEEKYVDVMKTTVQAVAGMPSAKPTIYRCGKCGAENPAGVVFCEKCGEGM
jgi:ribonuclease HII